MKAWFQDDTTRLDRTKKGRTYIMMKNRDAFNETVRLISIDVFNFKEYRLYIENDKWFVRFD